MSDIDKKLDSSNKDNTSNSKNYESIFIGGKPFMNYVTGVVMQFTTKNSDKIVIKARGKFISRAVDVAEVTTRRFLENTCEISDLKIGSEEFNNKEGKKVRVSIIEITLTKK